MSDERNMDLTPDERRLAAEIGGLGAVRPEAGFRARLRAEFVTGDLEAKGPRPAAATGGRARRLVWVALPTALAAGLALTMLLTSGGPTWTLRAAEGTGTVEVGDESVAVDDEAALRRLIGPGAHISTGPEAVVDVICGDIAVLGLAPGAEAWLPADPDHSAEPWEVAVTTGEVSVITGPDFVGRQLVLTTAISRTVITGTAVAVFACAELTCVCVLEGTAQIGRDAEHLEPVPAGMRKVVFSDGRPSIIVEIAGDHAENLQTFVTRNSQAFR